MRFVSFSLFSSHVHSVLLFDLAMGRCGFLVFGFFIRVLDWLLCFCLNKCLLLLCFSLPNHPFCVMYKLCYHFILQLCCLKRNAFFFHFFFILNGLYCSLTNEWQCILFVLIILWTDQWIMVGICIDCKYQYQKCWNTTASCLHFDTSMWWLFCNFFNCFMQYVMIPCNFFFFWWNI